MEDTSFSNYCESFLKNPKLGSLNFFKTNSQTHTYKNLIEDSYNAASFFSNSPDVFFALKFESSYKLFVNILGAILANKNILIISHKEPTSQISRLQENIPFTQLITDSNCDYVKGGFTPTYIEMNSERPAFFILSSGSSGPARGIPLSLNNIFSSANSLITFFKMNESDTSFLNLPHHHIGGMMIFWRAFFSKGSMTTDENSSYQFTSLVPLQLKRTLADKSKTEKLKICKAVLIGGSSLDKLLRDEALKLSLPIYETYGMSETSSLVMLNGKPLPGQDIKINSLGNFQIKSQTVSPGVLLDSDGYYHTKDSGRLNPDGTFSFLHRSDLLFKSGGELINPLTIEASLKNLPWMSDAVLVPVNHHEWTQAGALIYKTSDVEKTEEDVRAHLKNHFHPYLIPKFFIKASDSLINDGIKPGRYALARHAQINYFKNLFHHLYLPTENSVKLMVFFHGFMEDHTDLIALMDNHKKHSFLFIDLPGHGQTSVKNFKNRDAIFLELKAMIDFYKSENELTLYGYSMGGRVALELTLMNLKVENLILESAHFGLETAVEKMNRLNSDKLLFNDPNFDLINFFENWYKNPIFAKYNKSSHYKQDLEKKLKHDFNEWKLSLDFFSPGAFPFEHEDVVQKLQDQKITGIIGLLDNKYKNHFESMVSKIPGLSLYEIEDCGHNPHKTNISDIKKILGFID